MDKEIWKCSCNNRMSSLIYDFNSICDACCGCECDFDKRCIECRDDVMQAYAKHQNLLK